jgi:hypothetical protein
MERPLTVLRVSLHHPTPGSATFAYVPPQLEHDASPLLVGRGPDAHLRLQLPRLSRQHLSLEPYLEKGGTRLAFSLKALSRKGSVLEIQEDDLVHLDLTSPRRARCGMCSSAPEARWYSTCWRRC